MKILNIGIFGLLLIILVLIIVFIVCNVFDKIYANNAIKSNFSNSKNGIKRDKKYYGGGVNIFEDIGEQINKLQTSIETNKNVLNITNVLIHCLDTQIKPSLGRELNDGFSDKNYRYHIYNFSTIDDLIKEINTNIQYEILMGSTYNENELFFNYTTYHINYNKLSQILEKTKEKILFLQANQKNILGDKYFDNDTSKPLHYISVINNESIKNIIIYYNEKYNYNSIYDNTTIKDIKNLYNIFSNDLYQFNCLYDIYNKIIHDIDIKVTLTEPEKITKATNIANDIIKRLYDKLDKPNDNIQNKKKEILQNICRLIGISDNFSAMAKINTGATVASLNIKQYDKSLTLESDKKDFITKYKSYFDTIKILNDVMPKTTIKKKSIVTDDNISKINSIMQKINLVKNLPDLGITLLDELVDKINVYKEIIYNYKLFKKMDLTKEYNFLQILNKADRKPTETEFPELIKVFKSIDNYNNIKKNTRKYEEDTTDPTIKILKPSSNYFKSGKVSTVDLSFIYKNIITDIIDIKPNGVNEIYAYIEKINSDIIIYTDIIQKYFKNNVNTLMKNTIKSFITLKTQWETNSINNNFQVEFNTIEINEINSKLHIIQEINDMINVSDIENKTDKCNEYKSDLDTFNDSVFGKNYIADLAKKTTIIDPVSNAITTFENRKIEYDRYITVYETYLVEWKKLDNIADINIRVSNPKKKITDINIDKIKSSIEQNYKTLKTNFDDLKSKYDHYKQEISSTGSTSSTSILTPPDKSLNTGNDKNRETKYYIPLYLYYQQQIKLNTDFQNELSNGKSDYYIIYNAIQSGNNIPKKFNTTFTSLKNKSKTQKCKNLKILIDMFNADPKYTSKQIICGGTELIDRYINKSYSTITDLDELHKKLNSIDYALRQDYKNLKEFFIKFIELLRESNSSLIPKEWEWEDRRNKKQPVEWSNIPFFKQKTWSDPIKETQASTIYWRIKDSVGKKEIVIIERDDSIYKKDKNKIYYKPLTPDEKKMLKKRIYSENRDLIDETYEIDEIIDGINSINPVSGRYYIYQNGAWTNYLLPME
jgi:hypothetical protein